MGFFKKLFGGGDDSSQAEKAAKAAEERQAELREQNIKGLEHIEGVGNIKISEGKVIREMPGAALCEHEDEELLWHSTHEIDIPVDSWKDVWGPLGGKGDDTLATFCYHEAVFGEEEMNGVEEVEEAVKNLGYEDMGQYYAVRLTIIKHWGTRNGPELSDCTLDSQEYMSAVMKGQRMKLDGDMDGALQADPALIAPIEGTTMEVYAQISAQQAQGLSQDQFNQLLAQHGLDMAKWDTVSSGWTDRMSKDTTHTLTQIYGKAFQGAGQGQFGAASQAVAATGMDGTAAAGGEPIPFDKACEIQGATTAWSNTGKDVNAMLQSTFKMNAAEWAAANTWWMTQLMADIPRFEEYNTKVAEYEAKYTGGGGDPDSDLSF